MRKLIYLTWVILIILSIAFFIFNWYMQRREIHYLATRVATLEQQLSEKLGK